MAAAVRWVHDNIPSRGGDASNLILLGHSSGATMAALLASDTTYLARVGLSPRHLQGVIAMGSIMWDDELEQALARYGPERVAEAFARDPDNAMYRGVEEYLDRWPMRHVRRDMPPVLFLVAEAEREQPPVLRTNRAFADSAIALGNRAEVAVLPDRDHYSAIRRASEPGDPTFARIVEFVRSLNPRSQNSRNRS